MFGDSDEDDDDMFATKPVAKKPEPAAPIKKTAPAKKQVLIESDDDEDLPPVPKKAPVAAPKATEPEPVKVAPKAPEPVPEPIKAAQAAPQSKPPAQPSRPAPTKDDSGEDSPKLSMAELAAKINMNAVGRGSSMK